MDQVVSRAGISTSSGMTVPLNGVGICWWRGKGAGRAWRRRRRLCSGACLERGASWLISRLGAWARRAMKASASLFSRVVRI